MAIIGGVYSVMGIADGLLFNLIAMLRKKIELGKQDDDRDADALFVTLSKGFIIITRSRVPCSTTRP